MSCSHPIFVTGLGAVTPLGRSANETWDALAAPRPGFSPFVEIPPARFELGGMACVRAGLVSEEIFLSLIPQPLSLPPSRAARLAFAAAAEALGPDPEGRGTGIVTASNFGLVELAQPELARAVPEPGAAWQHFRHDTLTHALAEHFKLDGPRVAMSLSCASGASAIARAAGMIQRGEAQRVLAVGYDAVSLCAWSGLCALRTMAKEPPPRPFDRNRAGTVFAEGAGALLLESRESAKERGAAPAGALLGWATNNNAFHLTASPARGAGVADAARRALAAAGIQPRGVDYYNAHATATQQNDLTEFQALEDALSPALAREIPVAGHKGATGHLLGAAGAVESVMTLLAIREGVVPGTPQCLERDPETPVNLPATAVRQSIRCALKMSAGFGGCNTALLFAPP